jgi:outer membrane lipopolysaccharide assembly protein LptE/RlpB
MKKNLKRQEEETDDEDAEQEVREGNCTVRLERSFSAKKTTNLKREKEESETRENLRRQMKQQIVKDGKHRKVRG